MHSIIQELESNNSRLFKEEIIMREIANDNKNFFSGCRLALDPMITFGVKQVPQSKKDGPGLAFAEFVGLATQLRDRELTGHNARDAIEETMNEATVDEWNNWYLSLIHI